MSTNPETFPQLAAEARSLNIDAMTVAGNAERVEYNARLLDHLEHVARATADAGVSPSAVAGWADEYGLAFIAEPNPSEFTIQVAEDAIAYARRHGVTLTDAIHEWEGDGPAGGFELLPKEKSAVAAYLLGQGIDTDKQPPKEDPTP